MNFTDPNQKRLVLKPIQHPTLWNIFKEQQSVLWTTEEIDWQHDKKDFQTLSQDAQTFLHIIRSHWKIENSLHYVKDVAYLEDFDRTRTGQIPYVKTTLRNYTINLQSINKITNKTQSRKLFGWGVLDVFSLKCS